MKPLTAAITSALCLTTAAWLAWPSRNVHGNTDMEELRDSCMTDEKVMARLYKGNGGATTSFWYSVTLERDALGNERQIFFAYGTPKLEEVKCVGDTVRIEGEYFVHSLGVTTFQRLRAEPIQYWSGRSEQRGTQPGRTFSLGAAAVLAVAAAGTLLWAKHASRRASLNAA
jgi:hypothetical protein